MQPLLVADTKAGLLLAAAFGEALAVRLALGVAPAALGTAAFGEALGDAAAALGETAAACKFLPSCMLVGTASGLGDVSCICEGITCVSEELAAALASLLTGVSECVTPSSLGTSTWLAGAKAMTCCSLLVSLAACELGKSTFLLPSCLPTLLLVLLCLATAFRANFAPFCPAAADFDLPRQADTAAWSAGTSIKCAMTGTAVSAAEGDSDCITTLGSATARIS